MDAILKALTSDPKVLSALLPLLTNPAVLALITAYLMPSPISSPQLSSPIDPPVPDEEIMLEPITLPHYFFSGTSIESIDMIPVAAWADWLGGNNSDRATPDEMEKIFESRRQDLPPNGIVRFAANVKPQGISPVPYGEFSYHLLIEEEDSIELAHIVVDKAVIDGQGYIKSVPNRWDVTRGWEIQIKHIPFYGDAQAPDRKVIYWMVYKGIESAKRFYTWRHHKPLGTRG